MTHADGTQDEELYGAMRSAFGAEPPMAAQPHDDLVRGRRRLRHRRVGTVVAAGAVVPAVALIATVVPDGTPTDAGGPGFADAPIGQGSLEAECAPDGGGDGGAQSFSVPAKRLPNDDDDDKAKGSGGAGLPSSYGGDGLVSASSGDGSCEAVPGEVMPAPELDRLETALTEGLDPAGDHVSMLMAGAASAPQPVGGSEAEDAPLSQGSVSAGWAEGTREGWVDLTVIDPFVDDGVSGADGAAPCENPTLGGGPRLACERRELADGTSVLVGTGERDGIARLTVRFEREDGQVVWATSDQASTMWWEDGSGAEPLDAPPVSTEQLIRLTQDPRAYL